MRLPGEAGEAMRDAPKLDFIDGPVAQLEIAFEIAGMEQASREFHENAESKRQIVG